MQDGLRRMHVAQENVYYYLTVMNENHPQPAMPEGAREGILRGMHRVREAGNGTHTVQLLGSGAILREVLEAAELLESDFDVGADVWSVTSFNELRRDALDAQRWNALHPGETRRANYVEEQLSSERGPVIAATDYMKIHADQIRPFVPSEYVVLGTDGYGRSDSRSRLRHFFEVNAAYVVVATLNALADSGAIEPARVREAIEKFGIDPEKPNPVSV